MMRKYLKYIILAVLSALLLLNGGCSEKDNVTSIPAETAAATETEMTNAASEDEMAAADAETSYETETEAVWMKAAPIRRRRMWRSIFILMESCRKILSRKKRRKNSDGMAVHWSLMLRAWRLAATDLETMKACSRKKTV